MDIIGVARCGRAERNGGTCGSAVVTVGAATSSPEYSDQTPFSHHGIHLVRPTYILPALYFNGCTRTGLFAQTHASLQHTNMSHKRRISA